MLKCTTFDGVKGRGILLRVLFSAVSGLFCFVLLLGQNLVPNGGFETFSSLPTGYAQLCKASGWTSASNACTIAPGCGHPDYMHTAGGAGVQAPNTTFGTTMPHIGNAMIGFTPWYLVGVTNFREYPRITLSSPLVPGQSYTVSFWTTNGTNPYSGWGINNLGVAFTMAPLSQSCGAPLTGVIPQIEITTVVYSSTWQLHSFTFTPTQPFQFMTIGNFHNDAGTTEAQMSPTGGMGAYYFLDDVSVSLTFPLPIELLAFDAVCDGSSVRVHWSTASESNNAYFTVERSGDAEYWLPIGTVSGAGNSQQPMQYEFQDAEALTGPGYYRLKQTDYDGAYDYSPVVSAIACRDKEVLQRWMVDASGRICSTWPVAAGSMGTGIYLVRTEYTDGSVATAKVAVLQPY